MSDVLEHEGVDIIHHFGAGVYIKEGVIQQGMFIKKHIHSYDHLSVLCSGTAKVTIDGESTLMRGPKVIEIKAGQEHTIESLTPLVWLCIHATDETNPSNIDTVLINEN